VTLSSGTAPSQRLAQEHLHREGRRQRRLFIGAGLAYGLVSLWIGSRLDADPVLSTVSLGLLAAVLLLYGLSFLNDQRARLVLLPIMAALVFGVHIVFAVSALPAAGEARFALVFGLLALFLVLLGATWRAFTISLAVLSALALYGALVYLPRFDALAFHGAEALVYTAPFIASAFVIARRFQRDDTRTAELRNELQRRATSDDLTGVSNRAHITLLAQNEFARARRYGEPCSCLVLELDNPDQIAALWNGRALDTVVQVLTGYCVVVMRHCDSFGRLSPYRFLALLPETAGEGALTLAARMCRDIAALEVAVEGGRAAFTISIGAAEINVVDRSSGDLLRRAVQALEDAIEHGRGRAVLADAPLLNGDESPLTTADTAP
jgi:diguanylate cyclase (GGDEF)-like protein